MFIRIRQFFADLKAEFSKVSWPSQEQTIQRTIVVLILVLLMTLFLGSIDIVLSRLMEWALR